jgi:cytoskeletal protein CcmA (bactofilin family)
MNTNKSSVWSDVEIHGSVVFQGELAFGGKLTGGSIKGPILTVNSDSNVSGNIESDALVLHGTVTGEVVVAGKCELKETAKLIGDLTASKLVMGEGATFVGKAQINRDKNAPGSPVALPTPPAPPAKK